MPEFTKERFKAFLKESGRTFLVLPTSDLVDSLPWPSGVESLIQIINAYTEHRKTQVVETMPCPASHVEPCSMCRGTREITKRAKTDKLEPDEVEAAVVYLRNQ